MKAMGVQSGIAYAPALEQCDPSDRECLVEHAKHYAYIYGINETKYLKTIQNESSWIPSAVGDSGKAFGIAQYWEETFERHTEKCGLLDYSYTDYDDQLPAMACAFSKGWAREWTAFKNLK